MSRPFRNLILEDEDEEEEVVDSMISNLEIGRNPPSNSNVYLLSAYNRLIIDGPRLRKEQVEAKLKRADNQLCRRCSRVELNPEKLSRFGWMSDYRRSLGSFKDVSDRTNCPLCRITIAAVTNVRRHLFPKDHEPPFGIDPSEEVKLHWEKDLGFSVNLAVPECHISFVQEENEYGDEEDTEVPLKRARIQFENYDTVFSQWFECCQEYHDDACSPAIRDVAAFFESSFLAGMSYAFRLVDVESWCIIEARGTKSWSPFDEDESRHQYLALSYVWGQVHSLKLFKHNQEELMKRGNLKHYRHAIPPTILDAIHLTKQMGFRYLWVDALCLVQDNELDMLQGIHHMDLIYRGATLTIVAAAGANANAGLPGVRDDSQRLDQPVEEVKEGVKMTVVENLESMLSTSHYSGRAWTLQEQLFANRTLIFTPNKGAYFRCLRAVWSLDTIDDEYPQINNYQPDSLYMALEDPARNFVTSYNSVIMEVTKRDLTIQSDALNVFRGLENVLSNGIKDSFIMGLPKVAFDFYILFDGQSVTLERREWFPSWSWAGWKGCAVLYMLASMLEPSKLNTWLQTKTWIVWFHRRKGDEPQSLAVNPDGSTKTLDAAESQSQSQSQAESRFNNRHCPQIKTFQTEPTKHPSAKSLPLYSTELLQFWTLSVHLTIGEIESPNGQRHIRERGTIVDCDNEFCGSVRLDGYYFDETDLNKPVEFILLSECEQTMPGSKIDEDDPFSTIGKNWELYWVMLIQWDDDGIVAERRGLGQIFRKAVEKSLAPGPCWKEIILT